MAKLLSDRSVFLIGVFLTILMMIYTNRREDNLLRDKTPDTRELTKTVVDVINSMYSGKVENIDQRLKTASTLEAKNTNHEKAIYKPPDRPLSAPHAKTGDRCSDPRNKVKHFIMNKIEKTGSSTIFGLLARFVWNNKLNVLSQTSRYHIDWTKLSYKQGWVIGPWNSTRAEVMICHAKYNGDIYEKYFIQDYKYLVPVRDPLKWMTSAINYFTHDLKLVKDMPLETLVSTEAVYLPRKDATGIESFFHLPQLQWLGFDYSQRHDIASIRKHVDMIVSRIDMPILNDQFDASLIVMRRRFCWSYTDIFYTTYENRHRSATNLTDNVINRILSPEVNIGDLWLYESLNKTWWQQKELRENNFWEEVDYFTELNIQVSLQFCPEVTRTFRPIAIPSSQWSEGLAVTLQLCRYLQMSKTEAVANMRDYAQGKWMPLLN